MVLFHASLPGRSYSRRLGNVWTKDFSDLVWISSGSRPDLVPILSKAPNPNPRLKRLIKTLTQLCNPTDGSRVAGFQGCNVTRQCSKVPEFQDYRVPRFQGSRLECHGAMFQGHRVLDLQKIETHKRVVVGKFLRLHWELHLQFFDVQTIWTTKTQPECSISGVYWLNLVKQCFSIYGVHIGRNIKGTTKGWLPKCCVWFGECTKGTRRDDIVLLL